MDHASAQVSTDTFPTAYSNSEAVVPRLLRGGEQSWERRRARTGRTRALASFETPPVCWETKLRTSSKESVAGETTEGRRCCGDRLQQTPVFLNQETAAGWLSFVRLLFRPDEGGRRPSWHDFWRRSRMKIQEDTYQRSRLAVRHHGRLGQLCRESAHGVDSPRGEGGGGEGTQRAPSQGLAGPSFIHLSRSPKAVCGGGRQAKSWCRHVC